MVDAVVDKNNCERTKRRGVLVAGLARIVEYNTQAVGFGTR